MLRNVLILFTLIAILTASLPSTALSFGLGDITKAVEKLLEKSVEKVETQLETKIDEFVMTEVKKVERSLMTLYIIMILINMVYSTFLIFAARHYFKKDG